MPVLPEVRIPDDLMADPWVRQRVAEDRFFGILAVGHEIAETTDRFNGGPDLDTDRERRQAIDRLNDIHTSALLLAALTQHAIRVVEAVGKYNAKPKSRRAKAAK